MSKPTTTRRTKSQALSVRISLVLSPELKSAVARAAAADHRDESNWIRLAITEKLAR